MHQLIILFILGVCLCKTAWSEGNHAPPMDLAGVVPLPQSERLPFQKTPSPERCFNKPCSTGCKQHVTCENYNPVSDGCSKSSQMLVDWRCEEPCSCASDGNVVCTVSFRCVDMTQELEQTAKFKKPSSIDLSIPFSTYQEPDSEDNIE